MRTRPNSSTSTAATRTRVSTSGAAEWSARAELCCASDGRLRSMSRSPMAMNCRWGGLRIVHLPGHTLGHCGFYSKAHDLLFSGDWFASYFFNAHFPPAVLNSAPELIPASLEKARRLNAPLMVPQHYDMLDGALHRRRFDRLLAKRLRANAVAAE